MKRTNSAERPLYPVDCTDINQRTAPTVVRLPIDTRIDLPADRCEPVGLVLILTSAPGDAQRTLVETARKECAENQVTLAVVQLGTEADALERVTQAVARHANKFSGVAIECQGLPPLSLAVNLQHIAHAVSGESADEAAQGCLASPAVVDLQDSGALHALRNSVGLCATTRAQLLMAHERRYMGALEDWSLSAEGTPSEEGHNAATRAIVKYLGALEQPDSANFTLNLSGFDLTSLPPMPRGVTALYLDNNQLTSLDGVHLPHTLVSLEVQRNQLTSLPALLPPKLERLDAADNRIVALNSPLPAGLTELMLDDNRLATFPAQLPDALVELHLSGNPIAVESIHAFPASLQELSIAGSGLQRWPDQVPLPPQLRELVLVNNALQQAPTGPFPQTLTALRLTGNHITDIHDALLTLPDGAEVDLDRNPLSPEAVNRVLDMLIDPGYQGPTFLVPIEQPPPTAAQAIQHYLTEMSGDAKAQLTTAWQAFSAEGGAQEFANFMTRLANTLVVTLPNFRATTVAWLQQLATDPELRSSTFAAAKDATETCDDRMSLGYNKMQLLVLVRAVERGQHNDNPAQAIRIARQVLRLTELEKLATDKVKGTDLENEALETYLALVVGLHDRLDLPGDKPEMIFTNMTRLTPEDYEDIANAIKAKESSQFQPFLATWGPWKVVLKHLDPKGLERVEDHLADTDTWMNIAVSVDQALAQLQLSPKEHQDAKTLALNQRGQELEAQLMGDLTVSALKQIGRLDLLAL